VWCPLERPIFNKDLVGLVLLELEVKHKHGGFNIVQAISTTCAKMHIVPFFRHVKGHQDDKTAYGNLLLEAQLNVDADHEAGSYYQMHPDDDTPVRLIPGTCANLTINGNTISSGYKQAIQIASTASPLMAKIQEHNGWTTHDMSLIHWIALGRANRRMPSQMTQILKLSHDMLPTAAMVNRFDPKLPTSCMLCWHDNEDRDRILQCPHRYCHLWRHGLFAAIRNTREEQWSQPALLVALLIDGLDQWLRGQSTVTPALIDEYFHPLLEEQAHLGWRRIFDGRWSRKWAYLLDQYLREIGNKDPKYTGTTWLTAMPTTVWPQFFVVWSERKDTVHGNTQATRQPALCRKITRGIYQWFYRRDQLLQSGLSCQVFGNKFEKIFKPKALPKSTLSSPSHHFKTQPASTMVRVFSKPTACCPPPASGPSTYTRVTPTKRVIHPAPPPAIPHRHPHHARSLITVVFR
jgi:hypothetical protein